MAIAKRRMALSENVRMDLAWPRRSWHVRSYMEAVGVTTRPVHARWVRLTHWVAAACVTALAFSGVEILMVHPRLYWGEAGNDLTPPLLELPISRNHGHGGWTTPTPLRDDPGAPVSAGRHTRQVGEQLRRPCRPHPIAG